MVTKAAKAPMPPKTSGRIVDAARRLIRRTASSPAPMSTPADRYVSGSMNSRLRVEELQLRTFPCVESDLVLPREAGVAEVGWVVAGRLQHAVERKVAERVRAEVLLDLRHLVARADQLLAGRRVDAVVARPLDGRRRDPHVYLAGARGPHHLDDLAARGAADDGVVHDHDALAVEHLTVRVELDLDAEVPDALLGLDERPPDVVVAHEPRVVGQRSFLREAQRRPHARVGHGNHEVGDDGMLARQLAPQRLADDVHVPPPEDRVGPGEVDVLEHALELLLGTEGLEALQPRVVD